MKGDEKKQFLRTRCKIAIKNPGLSNKLFAATYDKIRKNCNCVPFLHTMGYGDNPQICAGTSLDLN